MKSIYTYTTLLLLCVFCGCKSSKKPDIQTERKATEAAVSTSVDAQQQPKTVHSDESNKPDLPPSLESTLWTSYAEQDLPDLERRINPSDFELWLCDFEALLKIFDESPTEVQLPFGEGLQLFVLENAGTMAPELAAKFPQLKSLKGKSADSSITVRVDSNEEGLFVEYKLDGEIYLLAPYLSGSTAYYIFYNKNDIPKNPRDDDFEKK